MGALSPVFLLFTEEKLKHTKDCLLEQEKKKIGMFFHFHFRAAVTFLSFGQISK